MDFFKSSLAGYHLYLRSGHLCCPDCCKTEARTGCPRRPVHSAFSSAPNRRRFFLLLAFGKNSLVGQFFSQFGFSFIFSWQGAVIASTVVSFPLMYRTVRGAFEQINPEYLYAARTLGMTERKIFRKIMLPGMAGHPCRDNSFLCAGSRRIRGHHHDRRQYPRENPDHVRGCLHGCAGR